MTNLFAEWRSELPQNISKTKPILCDITNVCLWTNAIGIHTMTDDHLIAYLPWDNVWFESVIDGRASVIFAQTNRENHTNEFNVFTGHKKPIYIGTAISTIGLVKCKIHINSVFSDRQEDAIAFIRASITESLVACTFSHCKNVTYYERECPPKLQKKRIKKGKIPQETYRILDIDGLQKQAKSESTKERGELQTALHICRGHFKTYSKEKPLMGKFTGTYWWPMHKRGSAEYGTVHKDYKITP